MILIISKNTVKSGKVEEFKEEAHIIAGESRKESGCISYELYQDIEKENIFTFVEKWESNEAIRLHRESEHFRRIVPRLASLVESKDTSLHKLV